MATKCLAPSSRSLVHSVRNIRRIPQQQRRTFLPNPFGSGPQTLTASRTLDYSHETIFDVISDVSSYSSFIPYCQTSTVTKSSNPDPDTKKTYPEEASLTIGFDSAVAEKFHSRIYTIPGTSIEALSGAAESSLPASKTSHHNPRPDTASDPTRSKSVLTHLSTLWTLKPFRYKPPPESAKEPGTQHMNHQETSDLPGQDRTDVSLKIEYQFANPVYGAMSAAAAPKVAEKMIEAFERRVKEVVASRGGAGERGKVGGSNSIAQKE
ncbi:Coenzyme Q-binding protein coq10, mitochondrial [Oleoguttula sp. CCFEE 5521]